MSKPLNGRCCPTGNTVPNLCQVVGPRIGTGVEIVDVPAVKIILGSIEPSDKAAVSFFCLKVLWELTG